MSNRPAITLERFSVLKAPIQGRNLRKLVRQESDWLKDVSPGTVERYRDLPHAIRNVARIATDEGMRAFIVREGRVAKGIATILFEQTLLHPTEGEFDGNDLDYWLSLGTSPQTHTATAYELMHENEKVDSQRRGEHAVTDPFADGYDLPGELWPHPIMATIRQGQRNPSIGLTSIMSPVEEPAVLTTPDGTDPYGLTKNGDTLQLYERGILNLRDWHET